MGKMQPRCFVDGCVGCGNFIIRLRRSMTGIRSLEAGCSPARRSSSSNSLLMPVPSTSWRRATPGRPTSMADLGVVGQDGKLQSGSYLGRSQVQSEYAKAVVCTTVAVDPLYIGYYAGFDVTAPRIMQGRDNVFDNPTPAQKVSRPGFYTTLVPVTAGYHVIAIDYLLIDPDANNDPNPLHNAIAIPPFPRLTIKANPEVGLLQDLTADATAGDGV